MELSVALGLSNVEAIIPLGTTVSPFNVVVAIHALPDLFTHRLGPSLLELGLVLALRQMMRWLANEPSVCHLVLNGGCFREYVRRGRDESLACLCLRISLLLFWFGHQWQRSCLLQGHLS